MASLKDITIFLFEAAWSDDFTEKEGYLPQASMLPYVKALAENFGCRVIYRQIRTEDDFKTWAKAIKSSKTGTRIVWIAGHGEKSKGEVKIGMPDYKRKTTGNHLSPKTIKTWLKKSGEIDGIIIDSCEFGQNKPKYWMPDNVKWGLAYTESVNWTESVFFGLKTLEWLYARSDHPKTSKRAFEIFEGGISTGGYREGEEQFSLEELGRALGVTFNYKTNKSGDLQQLTYSKQNS